MPCPNASWIPTVSSTPAGGASCNSAPSRGRETGLGGGNGPGFVQNDPSHGEGAEAAGGEVGEALDRRGGEGRPR